MPFFSGIELKINQIKLKSYLKKVDYKRMLKNCRLFWLGFFAYNIDPNSTEKKFIRLFFSTLNWTHLAGSSLLQTGVVGTGRRRLPPRSPKTGLAGCWLQQSQRSCDGGRTPAADGGSRSFCMQSWI